MFAHALYRHRLWLHSLGLFVTFVRSHCRQSHQRQEVGLDSSLLPGGVLGSAPPPNSHQRTFVVAAPLLATTTEPEGEPDPIEEFEVIDRPIYFLPAAAAAAATAGDDWDPIEDYADSEDTNEQQLDLVISHPVGTVIRVPGTHYSATVVRCPTPPEQGLLPTGLRFYAVWFIPNHTDLTGVHFGHDLSAYGGIHTLAGGTRETFPLIRWRRYETFSAAVEQYRQEARRRDCPLVPLVFRWQ